VWPGQAADSRGSGTNFSEVSPAASHFEYGHFAPQIFLDMLHGDTNSSSDARHGISRSGQAHCVNYMWIGPFDDTRRALLDTFGTPLIIGIMYTAAASNTT
jgi:hypothetical protein